MLKDRAPAPINFRRTLESDRQKGFAASSLAGAAGHTRRAVRLQRRRPQRDRQRSGAGRRRHRWWQRQQRQRQRQRHRYRHGHWHRHPRRGRHAIGRRHADRHLGQPVRRRPVLRQPRLRQRSGVVDRGRPGRRGAPRQDEGLPDGDLARHHRQGHQGEPVPRRRGPTAGPKRQAGGDRLRHLRSARSRLRTPTRPTASSRFRPPTSRATRASTSIRSKRRSPRIPISASSASSSPTRCPTSPPT